MSKSTHQFEIRGVDKSADAFGSIKNRAAATGAQIRYMVGGALAAAGAYFGVRSIIENVNAMGRLSDQAMKTGMSVEDLTRATTAFQVAGLDLSVDQMTKAMQYLNKNTGKQGMPALWDTVAEIAAIEDPAKRGAELMKNFGDAGMEFAPLVDGGTAAVQKMQDLISIMPGLSSAAANVGDEYADAMTFISNGTKSILQGALGKLLSYFSEGLPGGVRAGALNAMNWLETFAKKAHVWIAKIGTDILAFGALGVDVFTKGPSEAWKIYEGTISAADAEFAQRIESANKSREAYVEKLATFNVDDLANGLGKRGKTAAANAATAAAISSKAIRNELVLAGSNDAAKLAAFGPQYQSESKKQTALLEQIAKNTDATVTAVEESKDDAEVFNG